MSRSNGEEARKRSQHGPARWVIRLPGSLHELVGASMDKEPAGLYLRFYLDKEGGITLSDCERFHRDIQPQLERVNYDFLEALFTGDRPPDQNGLGCQKGHGGDGGNPPVQTPDGQKVFTGLSGAFCGRLSTRKQQTARSCFQKRCCPARRVVDLSILDDETMIEQSSYEQP